MKAADMLLRAAARWLLLAVLPLGVLLRSAFVWSYSPGPLSWGNLIHAHSHTAYFGWAGLGLMGLILALLPRLTGHPVADSGALTWLLRLAPWAVGGSLLTFAWQGYGPASITFATLNEVLWLLFALVFWREAGRERVRRWPAALWLLGSAVVLLLLAAASTLLVILAQVVLKSSDPVLGNAGIYLFLQAYGDGWLEAGLMGVAAVLAGGLENRRLAALQALAMLMLTAPAALRLLAPFGLGGAWLTLGNLAGLGLGLAQITYLWNMRRAALAPELRPWWLLAAGALAVKALMEGASLLPGWVALAGNRNLVIAFLHLKLLLIVTAGMIGALAPGRPGRRAPFWLFSLGAGAMVAVLTLHGFCAGDRPALGHLLYELAFWTGLLAAAGAGLALWPVGRGGVSLRPRPAGERAAPAGAPAP